MNMFQWANHGVFQFFSHLFFKQVQKQIILNQIDYSRLGTHLYLPIPMMIFHQSHKLVMFMLALAYKIETKGRCHNIYQEMQTCTRTCNTNLLMLRHC
jgi:hypothetical protein